MDDDAPADAGTPAWVMTFADLMSLLMCFFVLLLAFSEMDAQKFKQLSGSMKEAFGVQADIKADYIPKGTSVVTREFSPGKPTETAVDSIRQFTIDSTRSTLDHVQREDQNEDEKSSRDRDLERDVERLRKALANEIKTGLATVELQGGRIVVQIHEHGSFPSGSAALRDSILPTIDKLATQIEYMQGVVQVTGHTDDIPIKTARFRSNWDLSAARAVSVAHRLMDKDGVAPERMVVTGLADTLPLSVNTTAENRARNRRVQVTIIRTSVAPSVDDETGDEPGDDPDTPPDADVATDAAVTNPDLEQRTAT
ncbi:MAG: MotB family protein [Gammaproteobacteria bacterium]